MKEKECKLGGHVKPVTEFYKHPKNPDGYFTSCKDCMKEKRDKSKYSIF